MSFKKSTYPLLGLIEEFAKLNWIALRGVKNDSRTEDSANISQTLYLLTKKKKRAKRARSTRGGIVEFATEGPQPSGLRLRPVLLRFFPRVQRSNKIYEKCEHRVWTVLRQRSCGVLESETWSASSEFFLVDFTDFVPIDSWWQINDINDAIIIYQWLDFYGASITHRLFIEFWQYLMSNQLITHWLKQDKSD